MANGIVTIKTNTMATLIIVTGSEQPQEMRGKQELDRIQLARSIEDYVIILNISPHTLTCTGWER